MFGPEPAEPVMLMFGVHMPVKDPTALEHAIPLRATQTSLDAFEASALRVVPFAMRYPLKPNIDLVAGQRLLLLMVPLSPCLRAICVFLGASLCKCAWWHHIRHRQGQQRQAM